MKSQCKLPLYVSLLWILASSLKSLNPTDGKIQSSWLHFTLILTPVLTLIFIQSQMRTQTMVFPVPYKGTHESLGFWNMHCDSGFQVLVSVFKLSGFKIPKRAEFQNYFSVFMLFFTLFFHVQIMLYWKALLGSMTSLFSSFSYKLWDINVLRFFKSLWYNNISELLITSFLSPSTVKLGFWTCIWTLYYISFLYFIGLIVTVKKTTFSYRSFVDTQ